MEVSVECRVYHACMNSVTLRLKLHTNKNEETDCELHWVASRLVRVSGFCENGNEFSVFHKTPPEEASETDLGFYDKLVIYCPETTDGNMLTKIYKKFDPNSSGRWPTWRTLLLYNTFISILYMFRANTCSSSGGQFLLNFRHRASCILGQAFHYSPENAFYIFNQQIYFIIWYLLDRASLIQII